MALSLLILIAVCAAGSAGHVLASPVLALTEHLESGTPGPDAVTAFGAATTVPGTALPGLAAPVVGVTATPTGRGYWLVAADGGVFAFGDAAFTGRPADSTSTHRWSGWPPPRTDAATGWSPPTVGSSPSVTRLQGSTGGIRLNAPVVGMAATPTGAATGWSPPTVGSSPSGTRRSGDHGGPRLNAPVVGMAATPPGRGYWLVASDGGIFAFGDAPFEGSMGGTPLNEPVVGMAATPWSRLLAGRRRRRGLRLRGRDLRGFRRGTSKQAPPSVSPAGRAATGSPTASTRGRGWSLRSPPMWPEGPTT